MEFQNFGKHCTDVTCKQKDFLPFDCKFCLKTFCLDHRETKAHNCPKANKGDIKAIICPGCTKTIKYDVSIMNETEAFDVHYATECNKDYDKAKAEKNKSCEAANCNKKLLSVNSYKCDNCGKNMCLAHRYQDKHECRRTYRGGPVTIDDSHLFKKPVVAAKPQQVPKVSNVNRTITESCNVCGQSFTDISELLIHAEQFHYSQINNNSRSSAQPSSQPQISQQHHHIHQPATNCKSEAVREVCVMCGKSFTSIDELIFHAQRSHYVN
jgi:predicted nucleic acid binding AN1-type Zn finger protein